MPKRQAPGSLFFVHRRHNNFLCLAVLMGIFPLLFQCFVLIYVNLTRCIRGCDTRIAIFMLNVSHAKWQRNVTGSLPENSLFTFCVREKCYVAAGPHTQQMRTKS